MMALSMAKRPMRIGLGLLTLALGAIGGCAGTNTNLLEANRALQDRNTALTAQNESLTRLNQELQAALAARDAALAEAQSLIASLQSGKSGLEGQLAGFQDKFNNLRFGDLNIGATDPQTDQALRDLAAQHSDLLEYDAARGLLRFRSDFTFASGSDEVSSAARTTLEKLAGILNGPAAGYDARIVGHTDAQRISAATARRHPTNMHLSAHRSISVRNVLVDTGVAPARIEVAGRGEFDPLVANTGNGNTPANRRVEIFLAKSVGRGVPVPSASSPTAPAPSATPAPVRVTPRRAEDVMK